MPMPHRTFVQVAKRRLVGKEGTERVRRSAWPDRGAARLPERPVRRHPEVASGRDRADPCPCQDDPPRLDCGAPRGCRAGRARRAHPTRGSRRSCRRSRRSRSRPATTRSRPRGRWRRRPGRRRAVQLVEIPGLIEGATEDRGGGRALLGVLRNADAIVYCHAVNAPPEELDVVREEVRVAGIDLPTLVVATKADEAARAPRGRPVGLGARRREPRPAARGDLAAGRARARLSRPRRRARRRPARAASGRDNRGRRGRHPPRPRGGLHGGEDLGPVGALPRPASRPRTRRCRPRTKSRSSTEVGVHLPSASRSSTVSRRRMTVASPSRTRIAAGRGDAVVVRAYRQRVGTGRRHCEHVSARSGEGSWTSSMRTSPDSQCSPATLTSSSGSCCARTALSAV